MPYNGWTNRATWNVALWAGNDEGTYRHVVAYARGVGAENMDAAAARELAYILFPSGRTPDGDDLGDADFAELAEAWAEDA
jgi:hypothetical protein